MSDTDSAVLPYPLPDHLVGEGLEQMRLVHEIKQGIFIRKKFYYLLTTDNKEIIKSSGIDSSKLDYNSFKKLLDGESIEVPSVKFNVDWNNLNINVVESNLLIKGLRGNVKTIYNTPDVNYKFISFPVKYSIIIHPLYPYKTGTISSTIENKNNHTKVESDFFILFSKLELILFIIFILLFIIFITLYIYLIK